jgi:hypothetical protein
VRHRYYLEVEREGAWVRLAGAECSREYGHGYLDGVRDAPSPRLAWRLVRDDGRVVADVQAQPEVGVGQVAGWPSGEQYRAAAARAIQRAEAAERLVQLGGGR